MPYRDQAAQVWRAQGEVGVRRARLRCPWVAAGPGRASRRRAEPDNSDPAPLVWRAWEGLEGLAAVLVGGGGAWPDNESTRRAKLAARTTRGWAAAHGHTKQPGPHTKQPGTHTAHTAHTARGPKRRSASGPHTHACQLTG